MKNNHLKVFVSALLLSVLTMFNLHASVAEAGEYDNLPEIELSNSTDISDGLISLDDAGIDAQGAMNIPDTITYDGIEYQITGIGNRVFNNNSEITSVVLPTTLKYVGPSAFRLCTNLEQVEFNEGLELIDENAFYNCDSLTSLEFPSTLKQIGNYAFYGCTSVESIMLNEGLEIIDNWAFFKNYYVEEITFPSTIKMIGKNSFRHLKNLHKITYLGDVETMETGIFYDESVRNVLILIEDTNAVALNYDYDSDNIKIIKIEAKVFNLRNPDKTSFFRGEVGYLRVWAYYYPDEMNILFPNGADEYSTEIDYVLDEFMQEAKIYFQIPLWVEENTHEIIIESYRDSELIDSITVDLVVYGTVTNEFKTILK